MISILVPTYNYNTFPLVKEVHTQLVNAKVKFEIICIDDASTSGQLENSKINTLPSSKFEILEQNIGRSKIRNKLAELATYDWLLFLDADVLPKNTDFIGNYLDAISDTEAVICGGINYTTKKPSNAKLLRWVFGKKREEIHVSQRITNPYKHFLSANFLIHKQIFSKIKFNEILTTYGHEDTLFAIDLKKKQLKINHIDNAVYHLGIEENSVFIAKVKASVKNANYLYHQKLIQKGDIKLIDKFIQLKALKMSSLFAFGFQKCQKRMERNLCSKKPSLFVFDMYKLGFFCLKNKN